MQRLLHSVRLRLTLWYAAVLAVVLVVFSLSIYLFVVRTLQTNVDDALRSYGQQMNGTVVQHVKGNGLVLRKPTSTELSQREPIAALVVMDVHGNTTALVRKGQPAQHFGELRLAIESGHSSCGTFTETGTGLRSQPQRLRFCTRLIYHNGRPIGGIEVVESLAGVDKTLARLRLALLLGIPFALVLAGSGGWLLAGRALEPVDRVTQMARSITATDLSRRINLKRSDELGRLAGTFDEMIARLEQAFQEQKQLTADVSHELRSPLTVLEAQTTLALRRSRTPEEYRHVLASVQEEVERMSSMVNDLLMLARAEAGEEPVHLEPASLTSVLEPAVEAMRPMVEEKGVSLQFTGDPAIQIWADRGRLRQLVFNLLENALNHTSSGGRIGVTVSQEPDAAVVRVWDTGGGIAKQDLPHIFSRFYRGDPARERGSGSSGLGLAIASWIVAAHGGTIEAHSETGTGATFTITFPQAQSVTPAQMVRSK